MVRMLQTLYDLSDKDLSSYKEVFLLFNTDQDGIISFPELCLVMTTLGHRLEGWTPGYLSEVLGS